MLILGQKKQSPPLSVSPDTSQQKVRHLFPSLYWRVFISFSADLWSCDLKGKHRGSYNNFLVNHCQVHQNYAITELVNNIYFQEIFIENAVKLHEKVVLFEKVTKDSKNGEMIRKSNGGKSNRRSQRVLYLRIE